jgi:hypothetical protein
MGAVSAEGLASIKKRYQGARPRKTHRRLPSAMNLILTVEVPEEAIVTTSPKEAVLMQEIPSGNADGAVEVIGL